MKQIQFQQDRYLAEAREPICEHGMQAYLQVEYATARLLYEQAYRKGNRLARVRYAQMLWRGEGGPENRDRAMDLFQEGAEDGGPLSNVWLALAARKQQVDKREHGEAEAIVQRGRQALEEMADVGNDPDAMVMLADTLRFEECGTPDPDRALDLFRRAAWMGNPWAQHYMGILNLERADGARRRNQPDEAEDAAREAAVWFQQAVDRDHVWSQKNLGECFLEGTGVEQDVEKGIALLVRSAQNGNYIACLSLANYYGRECAYGKEELCLRVAVEHGVPAAMYRYAILLQEGRHVEKDAAYAASLLREAAQMGNGPAQYHYAMCLYKGRGMHQDRAQALVWMRRVAANRRCTYCLRAMSFLAHIYLCGLGTGRDPLEAARWDLEVAGSGLPGTPKVLRELHGAAERFETGAAGYPQSVESALRCYSWCADQGDEVARRRVEMLSEKVS